MLEIRHGKTLAAALFSLAVGAVSMASTAHAQPVEDCGNDIVEGDELCDGQLGCAADCTPLPHWECQPDPTDNSAVCVVLEGWDCDPLDPTDCAPICGDGLVLGDEQCDDGNLDSEDGCSDICLVETGWTCTGEPSTCIEDDGTAAPVCGDGIVETGEACDDGNTEDGDGCSATCAVEDGWSCTGAHSLCRRVDSPPVCGNGFVEAGEACDGQAGCADDCTWRATTTGGRVGSCASASSAGGLLAAALMLMAMSALRRRQRVRS